MGSLQFRRHTFHDGEGLTFRVAAPSTLEELKLELEHLGLKVLGVEHLHGEGFRALSVTFDRTRALSVDSDGETSLIAGFADYYFTLTETIWTALELVQAFREASGKAARHG